MSLAVAFIVRGFPVLSQTFVINQAAGLIERGHEVSILSLGDRPAAELKQHPSVRQYGLI
jgi:colanic acid/amylovoran biosynthesis glycosyltransferase